jgi:hypothetical protein
MDGPFTFRVALGDNWLAMENYFRELLSEFACDVDRAEGILNDNVQNA